MKKRVSILYLIAMIFVLGGTIVSSFMFLTRSNINTAEVASDQIRTYKKNTGEKAFATFASDDTSSQSSMLFRNFISKTVSETSYAESNKIFLTNTESNNGALGIKLSVTKYVKPNIMVLPTIIIPHDYFGIPLVAGTFREPGKVEESSFYISMALADKIIENQTINAVNYDDLINQKITTNCSRFLGDSYFINFRILGVLDDTHERAKFYKEALGENLCIVPYNAILYYFNSVYYFFEVGNIHTADSAFIQKVEEAIKLVNFENPQNTYQLKFYEKDDEGKFSLGQINNAYIAINEYVQNKDEVSKLRSNFEKTVFIILIGVLIIFLCLLLNEHATKLMDASTKESKIFLSAFLGVFLIISYILFSVRGLSLGNGLYVPFHGKTQAMSVVAVFGIFLSLYFLIGNLCLIFKKTKKKNINRN